MAPQMSENFIADHQKKLNAPSIENAELYNKVVEGSTLKKEICQLQTKNKNLSLDIDRNVCQLYPKGVKEVVPSKGQSWTMS